MTLCEKVGYDSTAAFIVLTDVRDSMMQEIKVTRGTVGVALGDGIAFVEQENICGVTATLIVSTKQLAEITAFLQNPTPRRFKTTDKLLEPVSVTWSKDTDKYVIEQGGLKVVGIRSDAVFA